MKKSFHVAVDGPVAAGKGTVSRLVADRLGFLYVDTGAMYRVAALVAKRNKLNAKEHKKINPLLKKIQIDLRIPKESEKDGRLITVLLDDEDVSWKIRTEEMGQGASVVSQFPDIRKILVKKQQDIAKGKNVVMEGRDITHNVLPEAQLKIFLTANEMIRVKRRYVQLLERGEDITFAQVYDILHDRDTREKTRKTNPLKIVKGAWVIDTSDILIEKVVELIVERVKMMQSLDI
ncbi:MAG: (d)CMP kinase [Patescibacteria group bacterium]